MKIDETGFALSADQLSRIDVLEGQTRSFQDSCTLLGLNKFSDFRHSDLSGVDFSKADLRGYDFTDADLSYSFGIGANWDHTTNFTGSNLTGSMFHYDLSRKRFFSEPENESDFLRLKRSDWSHQIEFMYNLRLLPDRAQQTEQFCKRLFIESGDASVRSDMIRILGTVEKDLRSHIAYLIFVCCNERSSGAVITAARVLAERFRNLHYVFHILYELTKHENDRVREIAYKGIFASRYFGEVKPEVEAIIGSETNGLTRRRYVSTISQYVSSGEAVALTDKKGTLYYDFAEPISEHYILRQADRNYMTPTKILAIIAELIEAGIPFKVADHNLQVAVHNLQLLQRAKRKSESWAATGD